ncbi:MAG TPA: hypothetical protein DCX45_03620 [Acinetobacter junii]|nr:hypothetical protein [Acinetobacter junii]
MTLIDSTFNSAFIDTNEFAVSANPSWSATDFNGILFKPGMEIMTAGGVIETTDPVFMCKDADASGGDQGDTIVIETVTYYVIKIIPDGLGMTYLYLSENASP